MDNEKTLQDCEILAESIGLLIIPNLDIGHIFIEYGDGSGKYKSITEYETSKILGYVNIWDRIYDELEEYREKIYLEEVQSRKHYYIIYADMEKSQTAILSKLIDIHPLVWLKEQEKKNGYQRNSGIIVIRDWKEVSGDIAKEYLS